MQIVGLTEFGGPEVLSLHDIPEPQAGPGEVRIRVKASAVSPADLMLRSGMMSPGDTTAPYVPGMDAAGIVDQVGEGSRWTVGDRVMGMALPFTKHGGAYAEYLTAPDDAIAHIPAGTGFEAAATIPMNGLTATQIIEILDLAPGATVVVVGAAGTLGGYVVQLAKKAGLTVVADAGESDRELLTSLGADRLVDRGVGLAGRLRSIFPDGVEALVDVASIKDDLLPAIADGGMYVSVLGWPGVPQRGIRFEVASVGREYRAHAKLDALRVAVESGQLTPRVAAVLPAAEAAEAHRQQSAGGVRGRFVLTF